jgi:hypothetical protein
MELLSAFVIKEDCKDIVNNVIGSKVEVNLKIVKNSKFSSNQRKIFHLYLKEVVNSWLGMVAHACTPAMRKRWVGGSSSEFPDKKYKTPSEK